MSEEPGEDGPTPDLVAASREIRRWLSSGRLQAESGAFCAWRDQAADTLAFEYPEITGYALSWFAGHRDPAPEELAAGRRAADWLDARLRADDRSARAGWDGGAVYTFDLGMEAAGLMSLGAQLQETRYVERGRATAMALAGYLESGELPALAPDGPPTSRSPQWSTAGRAHMVKCVQALMLAEQVDAGRRLVRQAMQAQASDGHFITQPGDAYVMLHPHLYAVEGLWMWGQARDDRAALERAAAATSWAWEHQLPSGGLPRWVAGPELGPEQLDVTGQAVRAARLLGIVPDGLDAAVARLLELSRDDAGHGRALGYRPAAEPHLNAWVTMFAGQALQLVGEPGALSWDALV